MFRFRDLLTCVVVFIGSVEEIPQSLEHICPYEIRYDLVTHNYVSSNVYKLRPKVHDVYRKLNSLTPVCRRAGEKLIDDISYTPTNFESLCVNNDRNPRDFNDRVIVFDDSCGQIHRSVNVPYEVGTYGNCSWVCSTQVSSERLTIVNGSCDLSNHPLRVIDHSGVGYVLSRITHTILGLVEDFVSTVILTGFRVLFELVFSLISTCYDVLEPLKPFEVVMVSLLLFPYVDSCYRILVGLFVFITMMVLPF
ncbi:p29 [Tea plant necrotic ring blotch virus]|uniref:p29 n=1 Tax=Tea plant necrotic ring blotch virus TaxID=2419939 RepID=A0A386QUI7_9VIRU|nr:p29 [Tea plant necrotic ring blotch virus]AYE53920.1 p29 [Tea plant necrotic ring blotch virus]URQ09711.1 P29 [Tea plant necrotic ring blotch virus]